MYSPGFGELQEDGQVRLLGWGKRLRGGALPQEGDI
jgi:hypothetical protein